MMITRENCSTPRPPSVLPTWPRRVQSDKTDKTDTGRPLTIARGDMYDHGADGASELRRLDV